MFLEGYTLTPHAHILQKIGNADSGAAGYILNQARETRENEARERSLPPLPDTGILSVTLNGLRWAYNHVMRITGEPEISYELPIVSSRTFPEAPSESDGRLVYVNSYVVASMAEYVESNPSIIQSARLTSNDLRNLKRQRCDAVWVSQPVEPQARL